MFESRRPDHFEFTGAPGRPRKVTETLKGMLARIYKPSKTAMQSGKAKAARWRLEFEGDAPRQIEPLMGWTSASDMDASEVRLEFESKEAAIQYAERRGIPYQVFEPHEDQAQPKAYSDNFAFRRRTPWTH